MQPLSDRQSQVFWSSIICAAIKQCICGFLCSAPAENTRSELPLSAWGRATNQLAMMAVQIVLNNSLSYYGALSVYGQAIPLACAGIIMKVNQLIFSVPIGISQGLQPIASFNYGAENYRRVKSAFFLAVGYASVVAVIAFIAFQLFPREIIGVFGEGSDEYYAFAVKFFRVFLFFTFLNVLRLLTEICLPPSENRQRVCSFPLTRQILFFLPLVIILPRFMGIDGIIFAGPLCRRHCLYRFRIYGLYGTAAEKNMQKESCV